MVSLYSQEKHYGILTYNNYKCTTMLLANNTAGQQSKGYYHGDDTFTDM